jgi:hypothetical protein
VRENPWIPHDQKKKSSNLNDETRLGGGSIHSVTTIAHYVLCSKAKILFQSFFMLMTVQLFFFASS